MAKGEAPQAKGDGKRDVLETRGTGIQGAGGTGPTIPGPPCPGIPGPQKWHMNRRHRTIRLWLYLGTALLAFFAGSFWLFHSPVPGVIAATCPYIDGGAGDDDATTDACPATIVHVTSTGSLTLQGNAATGAVARINFSTLTVDASGVIKADGQGCLATNDTGAAPNTSTNICSQGAATTGSGLW